MLTTGLTNREQKVIAHFDRVAGRPSEIEPPYWVDPLMAETFASWREDQELVDVACGSGRFAALLPKLKINRYLGIDASPKQIGLTRKTYPHLAFEVGNLYDLGTTYPARFDGFVCFGLLYFLPRGRIGEALGAIRACLKKDAIGLLSAILGSGTFANEDGLKIAEYSIEEMRAHLLAAGFEIKRLFSPDGHMLSGSVRAI